jgi:cell division septation protein DedD
LAPGFYVQYAALSSLDRATALASKVGGVIERTDAVFRVHRGPYAADAEAKRERARATGLGYRDAQIIRIIP